MNIATILLEQKIHKTSHDFAFLVLKLLGKYIDIPTYIINELTFADSNLLTLFLPWYPRVKSPRVDSFKYKEYWHIDLLANLAKISSLP